MNLSDEHFIQYPVPYARELDARHRAIQARFRAIVEPKPAPSRMRTYLVKAANLPSGPAEAPPPLRPARLPWGSPRSLLVIVKAVSDHYGVDVAEVVSKRRQERVVKPRQIAMMLCKQMTPHSYPSIGRAFGGKDHTTVIHAVRKYERLIRDDPALTEEVALIKHALALRLSKAASENGG